MDASCTGASHSAVPARAAFLDILDRHLKDATVRVLCSDGEWIVGDLAPDGVPAFPVATLVVHDNRFFGRALSQGSLGMGEAWMDGDFDVPDAGLPDLITLFLRSRLDREIRGDWRLAARVIWISFQNRLLGRRRNVERHFDVGDDLIESFLDPTLTYTCGFAHAWDDDLAALQEQKLERICSKLRLREGDRLLDIGCGYAGLLIHAAQRFKVAGTGIVNSPSHYRKAKERIERAGLADQIELQLADHRSISGEFDKVVSVGMHEHLPRREHPRYFANVAKVLAPGGLALAHFIGCGVSINHHDPFIQKYIFPGSCQLKLSEVTNLLERNELAILHVENIVRHYAVTCERWLENFQAARSSLDPSRYDERILRMFEYYLSICIGAARASDGAVYQVLYGKDFGAEHPLEWI